MKTKIQILKWMMVLVLFTGSSGVWAQVPWVGAQPGDQTVCITGLPEQYGVNNTPTSTYAWTVNGATTSANWTINSNGTNITTITWINPGIYEVQVIETTEFSCPGVQVKLKVTVDQLPTIAAAGTDQSVCGTLAATLAGNAPTVGTGTWTFVSGPGTITFSDANSATSTATASVSGTYVVLWTIANGTCTPSSDEVTLDFLQTPTIAAAGTDQSVCGTLAATLAGNAPTVGTGTWTFVSGSGTIAFSDANSATSTATASVSGTYVVLWTIANGTCTPSSDEVTITFGLTPVTSGIYHN